MEVRRPTKANKIVKIYAYKDMTNTREKRGYA